MELIEPEDDKLQDIENDYRKLTYHYLSLFDWTADGIVFEQNNLEILKYKVSLTDGFKRIPKGFYLLERELPESVVQESQVKSKSKTQMMKQTRGEGYKIHMSIFDENNDSKNLDKAWDIVSRATIKYGMTFVKVIKHEERENCRKGSQCGKEITWYKVHNDVSAQAIQDYLTDITRGFVDHNIVPGPQTKLKNPGGDLEPTITGSNYFSYRTDNISDHENPFKDIIINVENQPERQLHAKVGVTEPSTYNILLGRLDSVERVHDNSSVLESVLVDNDSQNMRQSSSDQALKRTTVNDEKVDDGSIEKDESNDVSDNQSGCCPC